MGTGAGLPYFLNIPGETSNGRLLRQRVPDPHQPHAGHTSSPNGIPPSIGKSGCSGGRRQRSMDAALTALRLGAEEVTIMYRRSEAGMRTAKKKSITAREEGVRFKLAHQPRGNPGQRKGWVTGLPVHQDGLGEPDASGVVVLRPFPALSWSSRGRGRRRREISRVPTPDPAHHRDWKPGRLGRP